MNRISLAEFENTRAEYDAAVRSTEGIDRFCSASDWVLAAHAAWAGRAPARILHGDHGYAVFLDHADPDGTRVLLSFDTMWGFTCPLAGPDPVALANEFAAHLRGAGADWQVALVSGLDRDSLLFGALARSLAPHFLLRFGSPLRRWLASLEGGLDGFLGRRTAKRTCATMNLCRCRHNHSARWHFDTDDVLGRYVSGAWILDTTPCWASSPCLIENKHSSNPMRSSRWISLAMNVSEISAIPVIIDAAEAFFDHHIGEPDNGV